MKSQQNKITLQNILGIRLRQGKHAKLQVITFVKHKVQTNTVLYHVSIIVSNFQNDFLPIILKGSISLKQTTQTSMQFRMNKDFN